jgi:hypothetical protein
MAGDAQGDVRGSSVTEDLARAMGDAGAWRTTRPSSAGAFAAPGGQLQLLLLGKPAAHHEFRFQPSWVKHSAFSMDSWRTSA